MIRGLFCGVSEYRANQQLPYCINDAKKMKEVFTENLVCSDDSIVVLAKDGRIENSEYIRELVRFSENCMEEDIAVVYYSGHGGIDERGDNYLYATNTFDGNDMTCVYFDVIIEHLKKSKAKSKLVIIDCCHADSNYGSEKQKFDTDKAIKDIYQSGITAVFSCRKDQESHPYYDNEISAFTQFFCDAVSYKKSYQPEGLYLSDLKITLDAYARVWNIKNESMQQEPVLRSNMIGTVVFPDAELKIFVTATAQIRAMRRYKELQAKGMPADFDDILKNVEERDYIDTHRATSPLRQADDALVLDNSNLTIAEQKQWLMKMFEERTK